MKTKSSRKESSTKRRRKILDAALDCFLNNGFEGTTIEQIRDASGVSHGSLYHHFRGKNRIALSLYVEGMNDYQSGLEAELQRQTTAKGVIRAIIAFDLKWVAANPRMCLYLVRVATADSVGDVGPEVSEAQHRFFQTVIAKLKPFIDRGDIRRVPDHLYVSLIQGPNAHLARHWLGGRLQIDLVEATDTLAEAAWKSLKAERE